MKNHIRFISIFVMMISETLVFSQTKYNDLYFSNLKGQVKSVSAKTIQYDSSSFTFGSENSIVTKYNQDGNCELEWEYLDTTLIQKRENVFQVFNGMEKRVKKITTHLIDSTNKTISYYYFDNLGFDTCTIICDFDSSYHTRYQYERNEQGLRTKGTEYNAKNGHKNYSFEIYYSKNLLIDSIVYLNGAGIINYTAYHFYNSKGELDKLKYSTGGIIYYVHKKRDEHDNWREMETFFRENGISKLVSRQTRIITYY